MSFQTAQISTGPETLTWDDSTPFNGYIIFTIMPPTGYTTIRKAGANPPQRLPRFIRVPVADGVALGTVSLPFTTSLEPPNCLYDISVYDFNDKLIVDAGEAPFTVTSDPVNVPIPPLATPTQP